MAELERAVQRLAELVGFPVLSGEPNAALAGHAAEVLRAAGAEVRLDPHPDGERQNVLARIGPDVAGGIVLCGHLDVVPAEGEGWRGDPFRLRREDGRLIARGAVDMKGVRRGLSGSGAGSCPARVGAAGPRPPDL